MDKVEIIITDARTPKWVRIAITLSLVVIAPISIGAYLHSGAMQWAGFIFAMLMIAALAKGDGARKKFTSIEDAKAYLDRLGGDA